METGPHPKRRTSDVKTQPTMSKVKMRVNLSAYQNTTIPWTKINKLQLANK